MLGVLLASPLAITSAQEEVEELFELSPFTVQGSDDDGYRATSTLAGTRIRTDLNDVGSAISVVTEEFLRDTAATDNESLLQYTLGTEVGGLQGNFVGAGNGPNAASAESGNFQNPSTNTRVRGLSAADNTQNFFLSPIPWDSYNVDRIDIQRGPNAVLFGFGSPAGIINADMNRANFGGNEGELEFRFDNKGSIRTLIDYNYVLLEDELSVRAALLNDEQEFRQDPAFEHDKRAYVAFKYAPKFLRSESINTTIEGFYENGDIDANRPRQITPENRISGFFAPWREGGNIDAPFTLNDGFGGVQMRGSPLHNPFDAQNNNDSELRYVGLQQRSFNDTGDPNPFFIPAAANFGQSFGGPLAFFEEDGTLRQTLQSEFRGNRGIGPDGEISDNPAINLPFARMISVGSSKDFAEDAGLPFAEFGQFRPKTHTDQSVFDFVNNLQDGPNKSEEQQWDHYNFGIEQTYLGGKVGWKLEYDRQDYGENRESFLNTNGQTILVDINSVLMDQIFLEPRAFPGDPRRETQTPNPNAGRPVVTDAGRTGSINELDRIVYRGTAFAGHDFMSSGDGSWWRRFLGRQQFTGMFQEQTTETWSANFRSFAMGQEFRDYVDAQDIDDNVNLINPVIPVGPSLVGRDSAQGLYMQGPKTRFEVPDQLDVRIWDQTWVADDVDPAAWWDADGNGSMFDDEGMEQENEIQANNPLNYRGWTNRTFAVDKASADNPDPLATGGELTDERIESIALILQNHFLDGAIVGMYGWREDRARSAVRSHFEDPITDRAAIRDTVLEADDFSEVDGQTQSWSLMADLNQLGNAFGFSDFLPINVRLFYNESENFQPAASRIDLFGRSLGSPSGTTIDRSILLSTKDNRYSLKVTKYDTNLTNATADRIQGDWFLTQGTAWGSNWADIFEFDIDGEAIGSKRGTKNDFAPAEGETEEDAAAREAAAVAGWRQHIDNISALSEELTGNPNAWKEAWNWTEPEPKRENGISATNPSNLTFTEDVTSSGYEFEFFAQPTENWTVTANAAKQKAQRSNVGGEALNRFVELKNHDLNNTPAGDLRVWWGGVANDTTLFQWNNTFNGNFNLTKLLEGTDAPELREWRFNVITNYNFTDGVFKGFNVGGGVRWQDSIVIGFLPEFTDETETDVTFDLDNPILGPTETDVDFWVGYQRKLSDRIDWRIQANLRNAFADSDDLIPVSINADGSVAAWRTRPTTTFSVTNTFTF